MSRKLVLYIATSIDGFIAKPNDDLSFLSLVHKDGEDYGYAKFMASVDTVILGRKTYDWVMTQVAEFPHTDKITFVITRTPKQSIGNTHFYTGNIQTLIDELKNKPGKNIFIDGGAQIVNELLKKQLIDEFIISIIPIVLGQGVRLFHDNNPEQVLKLIATQHFDTGLVQLHYTTH